LRLSIFNPGYLDDKDVKIWAAMAYWRAEEALQLSMNICPQKGGEKNDKNAARELGDEYTMKEELEFRARRSGELEYIKNTYVPEFPEEGPSEEISFIPATYVKWAISRMPNFPIKLYKAIKEKYPDEFANIADPIDIQQEKPEAALRNSQKAKERCQAIAEMLWDQDSSIKVKEMIEREEIQKYGQGSYYEKSTVYDWVTEVSPRNRNKQKQASDEDRA
jgi:hypothetical protein